MKRKYISILRFVSQIFFLSLFIIGLISIKSLMVLIILLSVLLGSIFCGWMCFIGLYQDVFRYIGELLKIQALEPTEKIKNFLKYSRYLILLGSVTIGGIFLFPNKVWGSFSGLLQGRLHYNFAFCFVILLGFLSIFNKRFFCRYLCPVGAKLGLYSLARLITINKTNPCFSCNLCNKECPMGISVCKINSLANPNCINCFKCIEICPNNTLKIGLRNYLKP